MQADARLHRETREFVFPAVFRVQAEDRAAVELTELVSDYRLGQVIIEVVKQIERRMDRIGFDPRMAVGVGLAPAGREAEARGVAPVGGVDIAPEGNHPFRHRAFRIWLVACQWLA